MPRSHYISTLSMSIVAAGLCHRCWGYLWVLLLQVSLQEGLRLAELVAHRLRSARENDFPLDDLHHLKLLMRFLAVSFMHLDVSILGLL